MSEELDSIKQELDKFASKRGPATLLQAKVLSINEEDSTVEVELDGGGKIDDVQLRSIVSTGDKVVKYPVVDSKVLIASINKSDEYYVVAVEEVSKISIEINGLKITINNKVKVEKGTDSLKTALTKIIEAVQQIVVLQGNNPNYTKLAEATTMINNLLE